MLVKVCGITVKEQYEQLAALGVDMLGFNFYPSSKRYLDTVISNSGPASVLRVGVFVDPSVEEIERTVIQHSLDLVQLHGHESAEFCAGISHRFRLIKVFGIDRSFDFATTLPYEDYVEYFLFDTKTDLYGGSGRKFDWSTLAHYAGQKEFLLSGGITLDDAEAIWQIKSDKLIGVDINSGFESGPGIKNMELIKQFFSLMKR